MHSSEAVPAWLWRLATYGLGAALLGVTALAAALSLGMADPPRAGPLVSEEDFKGGAPGWEFSASTGATIGTNDGALLAEFDKASADQIAVGLTAAPAGEFTLEVAGAQAQSEPGAAYGLVFGWQDAAHYNAVLVNGNGYAEVYRQAGAVRQEWFEWQQWPHILAPPERNRVRVDVRGAGVAVRINDELLVAVVAAAVPGKIGVIARSAQPGFSRVTFSWVKVWASKPTP